MSDLLSAIGDLAHGANADLKVLIRKLFEYRGGGTLGFDPPAPEREIGHKQQGPDRHLACKAHHKQGGRFHVDAQRALMIEVRLEFVVEFPKPVVRGVHDSRAIIDAFFDENFGHELLHLEGRERRSLSRQEVVRNPFIANGSGRKDEVAFLERAVQATTHPEEQHGLRIQHRETLDDECRSGRANREVDDRNTIALGVNRTHGGAARLGAIAEHGKAIEVIFEVREDDLLLKLLQITARVTLQNVASDFLLPRIGVDAVGVRDQIRVFFHDP